MIENRLEIDDILTRAGIPKLERDQLIDCGDENLARQLQGTTDANDVKRLVGDFYLEKKANVAAEDE